MDHGIPAHLMEKLLNCLEQFPGIESAILFGSRAMGTYRRGSDIDLSLIAPKYSLSELLKIELAIDDLLLPYKIDLSLFHQIDNPDLLEHIRRVGKVVYQRQPEQISDG